MQNIIKNKFKIKKRNKILLSILLVFAVVLCSLPFTVYADADVSMTGKGDDATFAYDLEITSTGLCTLYVYGGASAKADDQVTFLAFRSGININDSKQFVVPNIIMIDQKGLSNNANHSVKFSFIIPSLHSLEYMTIRCGSNIEKSLKLEKIRLPEFYDGAIQTNSLKVGHDIYSLTSPYVTKPDSIIDSIVAGGNTLHYKLGAYWYNLLDDACTSNAYFVSKNRVKSEEVNKWTLRRYYLPAAMIEEGSVKYWKELTN